MIGQIVDKQTGAVMATLEDDFTWRADDPEVAAYLHKHHAAVDTPSYMGGAYTELDMAAHGLGAIAVYDAPEEPDVDGLRSIDEPFTLVGGGGYRGSERRDGNR